MAEAGKKSRRTDVRQWVYGGVLLFAVVGGTALMTVPALHVRLLDRAAQLAAAFTGDSAAAIMPMGAAVAIPPEYLPPAAAAKPAPRTLVAADAGSELESTTRRRLTITGAQPGAAHNDGATATTPAENPDNAPDTETEPRFTQGNTEREAYNKVLAANATLSDMVNGSDPQLRFKEWGATRRAENLYWVRVTFTGADGAEVQYLWQTDMASGKTVPLSFNARNIS